MESPQGRKKDRTNNPTVEEEAFSIEDRGISNAEKIDRLLDTAVTVREELDKSRRKLIGVFIVASLAFVLVLSFVAGILLGLRGQAKDIRSITSGNRANGDLLVECVTPGPNPPPVTGNACWDRLRDTSALEGTINKLVDNLYCDHRRALAGLPPVSDPNQSCRSQTSARVLGQ